MCYLIYVLCFGVSICCLSRVCRLQETWSSVVGSMDSTSALCVLSLPRVVCLLVHLQVPWGFITLGILGWPGGRSCGVKFKNESNAIRASGNSSVTIPPSSRKSLSSACRLLMLILCCLHAHPHHAPTHRRSNTLLESLLHQPSIHDYLPLPLYNIAIYSQ